MSMEDVLSEINEKSKNPGAGGANCANPRSVVNADQEVWIRNQIRTAIRMALSLKTTTAVSADYTAFEYGVDGIADGVAVEIIHILNMEPSYVNLRRR